MMNGLGFRSYVWDPLLLISQIVAVQTSYYLFLCLWFLGLQTLVDRSVSFNQIFDYKELDFSSGGGKIYTTAYVLNTLSCTLCSWFIVQRAKLCLDFTVTAHVFHILLTSAFGGLPRSIAWWLLNGACLLLIAISSEYLCMRYELKDIKLPHGSAVSWWFPNPTTVNCGQPRPFTAFHGHSCHGHSQPSAVSVVINNAHHRSSTVNCEDSLVELHTLQDAYNHHCPTYDRHMITIWSPYDHPSSPYICDGLLNSHLHDPII